MEILVHGCVNGIILVATVRLCFANSSQNLLERHRTKETMKVHPIALVSLLSCSTSVHKVIAGTIQVAEDYHVINDVVDETKNGVSQMTGCYTILILKLVLAMC